MTKEAANAKQNLRILGAVEQTMKGHARLEKRLDRLEHLVERVLMQRLSENPMGDPLVSHLED